MTGNSYPAVRNLVPHEFPILAVEKLLEWRPGFARSSMVVREDGVFVRDGFVATDACLEYLAQTVAACLGFGAYSEGAAVRVGMMIACRRLTIHRQRIAVGEELFLEVRQQRGNDEASTYLGQARDASEELLCEAVLTLVHPERPPERRGSSNKKV